MPEIPAAAKAPQDHLSRSEPTGPFTFTVADVEYTLPDAQEASQLKIPGHVLRAAAMKEPLGDIGLTFASLDVSGASRQSLDALYSLPFDEVANIYVAWSQHRSSPEAATLGESGDSPT